MAVCAEAGRKKECVGDKRCWGVREMGGGGYRAEMSCSDVTSAVSRQDAAMCHTDERRGTMGRKLNVWQGKKSFSIKVQLYLCELQCHYDMKVWGCEEEGEGDGRAQIKTELCWKQKEGMRTDAGLCHPQDCVGWDWCVNIAYTSDRSFNFYFFMSS